MSRERPLRVALVSLGCPKNLIDSEKMLACLAEGGCIVGAPMDGADVIVINTCGFIAPAREESMDVIAEALEHKRSGRARRVVVAGCLVERGAEGLLAGAAAEGVDAVVGVNSRDDILRAVRGEVRVCRGVPAPAAVSDAGRFRLTPRHTAYLRISEGCSHRCTFCTIPDIRGPFRSKPPEVLLAEARELIADGAVELNLIGQDTTRYGADLGPGGPDLAWLLRALAALPGARWVRLMYAHPRGMTDAVLSTMADCPAVVPYVDLPLQHVSTEVLRRMGRGMTRPATEALLGRIRRLLPAAAIRTTFLAGFPGETEECFEELLAFVKEFRFDALGVFRFSPEEGTPAAAMPDAVPADLAAERAERIMLAQQEIVREANRRRTGSEVRVLVDGREPSGRWVGRTPQQAPDIDGACLLTGEAPPGEIVRGRVIGYDVYDLIVEPIGVAASGE